MVQIQMLKINFQTQTLLISRKNGKNIFKNEKKLKIVTIEIEWVFYMHLQKKFKIKVQWKNEFGKYKGCTQKYAIFIITKLVFSKNSDKKIQPSMSGYLQIHCIVQSFLLKSAIWSVISWLKVAKMFQFCDIWRHLLLAKLY